MSKKRQAKRPTLAEIVADLEAAPAAKATARPIIPGLFNDGALYDPEGRELTYLSDDTLEPNEVRAAVLAGARLVWDACGCGGYCNALEWPDMVALRREAESSSPRFRKNQPSRADLLSGDGGEVVLASGGL